MSVDRDTATDRSASAEAHGDLIAAAPELLEALERLLANREDGGSCLDPDGGASARARAAIAKATGAAA